jgi:hypothetical protein
MLYRLAGRGAQRQRFAEFAEFWRLAQHLVHIGREAFFGQQALAP